MTATNVFKRRYPRACSKRRTCRTENNETSTSQSEEVNCAATQAAPSSCGLEDLEKSIGDSTEDEEESDDEAEGDDVVFTPDQVLEDMKKSIAAVKGIIALPEKKLILLLNHFKWDEQKLQEKYFSSVDAEGEKSLLEEANVPVSEAKGEVVLPAADKDKLAAADKDKLAADKDKLAAAASASDPQEVTCIICYDTVSMMQVAGIGCGHLFCCDCWNQYLTTKIMDEGYGMSLECPACSVLLDAEFVLALLGAGAGAGAGRSVAGRARAAFLRAVANGFVAAHRRIKWCPAPDCDNAAKVAEETAVKVARGRAHNVKCECGHEFCFGCLKECHDPLHCDLLRKWESVIADDDGSSSSKWIVANAKACPNSGCSAVIEKNGGCNRMVCQSCKFAFCWICCAAWGTHFSANCNVYSEKKEEAKKKAKAALLRLEWYGQRYQNQSASLKLERLLFAIVQDKMEELIRHANISWIDVQFLLRSVESLCRCRRTVMYSYGFAFFLKRNNQSEIFEENQRKLAEATEELSGFLERDLGDVDADVDFDEFISRVKRPLLEKSRFCGDRTRALVDHVRAGYKKHFWQFEDDEGAADGHDDAGRSGVTDR